MRGRGSVFRLCCPALPLLQTTNATGIATTTAIHCLHLTGACGGKGNVQCFALCWGSYFLSSLSLFVCVRWFCTRYLSGCDYGLIALATSSGERLCMQTDAPVHEVGVLSNDSATQQIFTGSGARHAGGCTTTGRLRAGGVIAGCSVAVIIAVVVIAVVCVRRTRARAKRFGGLMEY